MTKIKPKMIIQVPKSPIDDGNFYIGGRPRPCYNCPDYTTLASWCKHYHKHNNYPCNERDRFLIGLYQIYQGMAWHDHINKNESFIAAAIHFIACAEYMDLDTTYYRVINTERNVIINSLLEEKKRWINFKNLMEFVSRCSQQLIYGKKRTNYSRASRFNKDTASKYFSLMIWELILAVEPEDRQRSIELATTIMTGRL